MFLAFLFGAIGAIVAEVLKRWQQWNDMPEKRFLALVSLRVQKRTRSIGPYVSSSVSERAFQEAIRLNPQDALGSNSVADLLQEPWGLEKLSSLNEKADKSLGTPIGWRDIFN